MRNLTTALLLFGALVVCGACDPIRAIDQSVDCNNICARYRDCYNPNYDVAACRSRCENYVHGDGGHADQANQCNNCLDPHSCATIPFSCTTQCAGIIP